jgi:hypothetical protein
VVAGHAARQRHDRADDREVERLANASGFAVRRLTFGLWRPAGLRAFGLASDMLRDGRKAKTL